MTNAATLIRASSVGLTLLQLCVVWLAWVPVSHAACILFLGSPFHPVAFLLPFTRVIACGLRLDLASRVLRGGKLWRPLVWRWVVLATDMWLWLFVMLVASGRLNMHEKWGSHITHVTYGRNFSVSNIVPAIVAAVFFANRGWFASGRALPLAFAPSWSSATYVSPAPNSSSHRLFARIAVQWRWIVTACVGGCFSAIYGAVLLVALLLLAGLLYNALIASNFDWGRRTLIWAVRLLLEHFREFSFVKYVIAGLVVSISSALESALLSALIIRRPPTVDALFVQITEGVPLAPAAAPHTGQQSRVTGPAAGDVISPLALRMAALSVVRPRSLAHYFQQWQQQQRPLSRGPVLSEGATSQYVPPSWVTLPNSSNSNSGSIGPPGLYRPGSRFLTSAGGDGDGPIDGGSAVAAAAASALEASITSTALFRRPMLASTSSLSSSSTGTPSARHLSTQEAAHLTAWQSRMISGEIALYCGDAGPSARSSSSFAADTIPSPPAVLNESGDSPFELGKAAVSAVLSGVDGASTVLAVLVQKSSVSKSSLLMAVPPPLLLHGNNSVGGGLLVSDDAWVHLLCDAVLTTGSSLQPPMPPSSTTLVAPSSSATLMITGNNSGGVLPLQAVVAPAGDGRASSSEAASAPIGQQQYGLSLHAAEECTPCFVSVLGSSTRCCARCGGMDASGTKTAASTAADGVKIIATSSLSTSQTVTSTCGGGWTASELSILLSDETGSQWAHLLWSSTARIDEITLLLTTAAQTAMLPQAYDIARNIKNTRLSQPAQQPQPQQCAVAAAPPVQPQQQAEPRRSLRTIAGSALLGLASACLSSVRETGLLVHALTWWTVQLCIRACLFPIRVTINFLVWRRLDSVLIESSASWGVICGGPTVSNDPVAGLFAWLQVADDASSFASTAGPSSWPLLSTLISWTLAPSPSIQRGRNARAVEAAAAAAAAEAAASSSVGTSAGFGNVSAGFRNASDPRLLVGVWELCGSASIPSIAQREDVKSAIRRGISPRCSICPSGSSAPSSSSSLNFNVETSPDSRWPSSSVSLSSSLRMEEDASSPYFIKRGGGRPTPSSLRHELGVLSSGGSTRGLLGTGLFRDLGVLSSGGPVGLIGLPGTGTGRNALSSRNDGDVAAPRGATLRFHGGDEYSNRGRQEAAASPVPASRSASDGGTTAPSSSARVVNVPPSSSSSSSLAGRLASLCLIALTRVALAILRILRVFGLKLLSVLMSVRVVHTVITYIAYFATGMHAIEVEVVRQVVLCISGWWNCGRSKSPPCVCAAGISGSGSSASSSSSDSRNSARSSSSSSSSGRFHSWSRPPRCTNSASESTILSPAFLGIGTGRSHCISGAESPHDNSIFLSTAFCSPAENLAALLSDARLAIGGANLLTSAAVMSSSDGLDPLGLVSPCLPALVASFSACLAAIALFKGSPRSEVTWVGGHVFVEGRAWPHAACSATAAELQIQQEQLQQSQQQQSQAKRNAVRSSASTAHQSQRTTSGDPSVWSPCNCARRSVADRDVAVIVCSPLLGTGSQLEYAAGLSAVQVYASEPPALASLHAGE